MERRLRLWIVFLMVFRIIFSFHVVTSQEICPENTLTCEDDYDDQSNHLYYDKGAAHDVPADSYYEPAEGMVGYDESDYYETETNSTCLPISSRCNGVRDCPSCSDERNCSTPTVFWCEGKESGLCLPLAKQCDNHTDCPGGSDECGCPGSFRCPSQQSSSTCIAGTSVCDGKEDCPGGEDENSCPMYVCPSNKKEILETKRCDGNNDCGDNVASDECNCSSTFVCDTGECINNNLVCNGKADCRDGTDECDCSSEDGRKAFFRCQGSGMCIARDRVCDGKLDCGSYVTTANTTNNQGSYYVMDCSDEATENCATHFMCLDAQIALRTGVIDRDLRSCVTSKEHCDGEAQCGDASDECDCSDSVFCPSPGEIEATSARCIRRQSFCNMKQDCSGGLDEKVIGFGFKCKPGSSHALSAPCILPQYMVDDGVTDCGNEADKCYRNGKWRCFRCVDNSLLISDEQVCDGIVDCPDLSDECMCSRTRPDVCDFVCGMNGLSACPASTIKCESSRDVDASPNKGGNLSFSHICDGVNDCSATGVSIDESSCLREIESVKDMTCPFGGTNQLRPQRASRCDGRPECADFADECDPDNPCPVVPLFCKNVSASVDIRLRGERRFPCSKGLVNTSRSDSIGLPGGLVCNGEVDCAVHGEDEIELYCPQRYVCETGDHLISIDVRQKCDGRRDCLDGSDEMNCTEYFYCENGEPLFVPKSVRFDGRDDCSDKSDECPTEQLEGAFASKAEMIASPFLSALVWIMATISTVGNIAVIIHQIVIFVKYKKHSGQNVALCNRVMILNLACADLLTGIYLFILAGKIQRFSGTYCHQDKYWRTSTACADLGLLNSIATEAAVVILVIMTTYRMLAVYKPFYTTSVKPEKVAVLCVSSWIFVISLMMIPRLHSLSDYFSITAWYPLPFFDGDVVERSTIIKFIQRYNVLTGNINATTENSWQAVEEFVRAKHFNETRFALFGYYSKHSVCIPDMLAGYDDAAVGFSAFITGFNLCAFFYVVISYIFIYRGAVEKTDQMTKQYSFNNSNSYMMRSYSTKPLTGEREPSKSITVRASSAKSTAMQRRIYRLVASNLACWLPLTIMAVAKLFGADLSNDAYAVAAIVLLPITSALNPLLYSNFVSVAWVRIKVYCGCMKRREDSFTQGVPITDRSQLSTSVKSAKV